MRNKVNWEKELWKKFSKRYPNTGKAVFNGLLKAFIAGEGIALDNFDLSEKSVKDFEQTFLHLGEKVILEAFDNLVKRILVVNWIGFDKIFST